MGDRIIPDDPFGKAAENTRKMQEAFFPDRGPNQHRIEALRAASRVVGVDLGEIAYGDNALEAEGSMVLNLAEQFVKWLEK